MGVLVGLSTLDDIFVAPLCEGMLERSTLLYRIEFELTLETLSAVSPPIPLGVISLYVCYSSIRNSLSIESTKPLSSSLPICENPPPVPSTPTTFRSLAPV